MSPVFTPPAIIGDRNSPCKNYCMNVVDVQYSVLMEDIATMAMNGGYSAFVDGTAQAMFYAGMAVIGVNFADCMGTC